mmetsp:Transcript_11947/g.34064  ORF Transcript_11947/g.34064 Transcript_11947/m.34064 type:complete len:351 (-) Transcript_11947:253-1305(-)
MASFRTLVRLFRDHGPDLGNAVGRHQHGRGHGVVRGQEGCNALGLDGGLAARRLAVCLRHLPRRRSCAAGGALVAALRGSCSHLRSAFDHDPRPHEDDENGPAQHQPQELAKLGKGEVGPRFNFHRMPQSTAHTDGGLRHHAYVRLELEGVLGHKGAEVLGRREEGPPAHALQHGGFLRVAGNRTGGGGVGLQDGLVLGEECAQQAVDRAIHDAGHVHSDLAVVALQYSQVADFNVCFPLGGLPLQLSWMLDLCPNQVRQHDHVGLPQGHDVEGQHPVCPAGDGGMQNALEKEHHGAGRIVVRHREGKDVLADGLARPKHAHSARTNPNCAARTQVVGVLEPIGPHLADE